MGKCYKTVSKCSLCHFFPHKITVCTEKRKNRSIFYYKNKYTYEFLAYTSKTDFGNISESDEFRDL